MKNKELKNVFIYARYSSHMQTDMSIKAQLRAIKEFCKDKYKIIGTYVDEAKSATNDARPEFQRMISDTKNTNVQAVIVHKLDRFSRNRYDAYMYKALLEKRNVKLISVTEQIDNSPEGEFMESIMFAMSDFYSKNLAREVQKGKKEAAHQALYLGGTPAYGYDVDENRKYILNPKESKAVKLIFDMYLNDYSYQQIADALNKRGCRTKKGLEFNKNSFSSILENAERYAGVYIYNKTEKKRCDGTRNSHAQKADEEIIKISGGMPRIISDETFYKVKEKMKINKEIIGKFHSKRYYLLNGLIRCGECGKSYTGNTSYAGRNKTKYSIYRCKCSNKDVNIIYLNDYILTLISDMIFDNRYKEVILRKLNDKLKKRIKENTNKMVSYKNAMKYKQASLEHLKKMVGYNEDEKLKKEYLALETEIDEYNKLIAECNSYDKRLLTDDDFIKIKKYFKKYMTNCSSLVCRKLIRSMIREIIIYHDKIEVLLTTSADEMIEKKIS